MPPKFDKYPSFLSTESYDSCDIEMLEEVSPTHKVAPHDIVYTDPDLKDSIVIVKVGDELPVEQTKFKTKKGWPFLLRFRYF